VHPRLNQIQIILNYLFNYYDDANGGDDMVVSACWCQHWFEYFPNPPINVLSLVENVLTFHDKELLHHFVRHGITSQVHFCVVLNSFFQLFKTRFVFIRVINQPKLWAILSLLHCSSSARIYFMLYYCQFWYIVVAGYRWRHVTQKSASIWWVRTYIHT